MPRVVVVGGGLSGLEFAVALQSCERYEIVLLEWGNALRKHHEQEDGRHYGGDQRTRTWRTLGTDWGDGSGLKRRLGGRSLCWHGVVLPIEDYALTKWPGIWQQRFWRDGLYSATVEHVNAQLPSAIPSLDQDSRHGLAAVPQASISWPVNQGNDSGSTHRRVYSPLHTVNASRVRVVKGARVNRVIRRNNALSVDFSTIAGLHSMESQLCILAAGAVENARIVCDSVGEPITGNITDHHCVGVVSGREESSLGIEVKQPLGYLRWPDLRCNVFVQEERLSYAGAARRIVDAWALAEQDLMAGSPFAIHPASTRAGFGSVAIDTHISVEDRQRLNTISRKLNNLIRTYPGTMSGEDAEMQPHYQMEPSAMRRVIDGSAGHLHYRIPLGSVDHEAGTLPMGQLIDADLGFTGFDGVYVLGPGVFPASGAANPSLTSLALSNWLAQHLISDL